MGKFKFIETGIDDLFIIESLRQLGDNKSPVKVRGRPTAADVIPADFRTAHPHVVGDGGKAFGSTAKRRRKMFYGRFDCSFFLTLKHNFNF